MILYPEAICESDMGHCYGNDLRRENGGDKLVHGSGGNVPAAGGAEVCHL